MHQWCEYQVFAHADVVACYFGEFFGNAFVNFPVGFRLPQRLHRFTQWVDEWVHVRGVQIVFFVPSCGWQYHVGVQTGGGHTEVQYHEQVEFTLSRWAHFHFGWLDAVAVVFVTKHSVLRAE